MEDCEPLAPREFSPTIAEEEPTPPLEDAFCEGSSNDASAMSVDGKNGREEQERTVRVKQFQHLLNKSKFYTRFLIQKMDQQKTQRKKDEATAKTKREQLSNISQTTDSTQDSIEPASKRPKRSASKKRKNIQFIDVVNDEAIKRTKEVDESDPNSEVDTFSRQINGESVSDKQPKWFTGGVMRNYQIAGFEWLKVLYENGINGILADEMGLGKTIQTIALLCHLIENGVNGPFLICAPLSTLKNWMAEFKRFTPLIPTLLYYGHAPEREMLRSKISKKKQVETCKWSFPVVITSYDLVMNDRRFLQQYSWKYIVIDEGHRIKNFNCRLVRDLKSYRSVNRLLLTGTPLHNNLSELWSLLNFLLPEIFDKLDIFESWFNVDTMQDVECDEKIILQEQQDQALSTLHEILSPFLLRRLKADVELFIPPKKELLVYAPLTPKQEEFYTLTSNKTILDLLEPKHKFYRNLQDCPSVAIADLPAKRTRKSLYDTDVLHKYLMSDAALFMPDEITNDEPPAPKVKTPDRKNRLRNTGVELVPGLQYKQQLHIRLQNVMMQLRKCCNHPYLLSQPMDSNGECLVTEELARCSGKILVLDAMLPKLKKGGHKILLFSQMTRMLDILQDFCTLRNYSYSILDGRCSMAEREEEIERFAEDPETFIFLLSTRAGGLGLNLTAADTVIIYDSDWNPQCDLQAMDRCHRIGQTKPVVVYRLVTANTIDQRIVDRAAGKRKLEKMVMHKDKFKSGVNVKKEFNKEELLELLQSTDHERVVRSGSVNCVFTKEELDALLDRSSMITNNNKANVKSTQHIFKVVEEFDDENKFRLH